MHCCSLSGPAHRAKPMRNNVDPTSMAHMGFMLAGAPPVCDELDLEFEDSADPNEEPVELVEFAPLLTGKREEVKSTVGSLDTVVQVPPDSVVLGSYAKDLTTPSLPSMTIEFVLAAKHAPGSTLGGAVKVLVVLETTLMIKVAEKSSGTKANSVWTPRPCGWKMETALPCIVGKEAGLYACGVGCIKEK